MSASSLKVLYPNSASIDENKISADRDLQGEGEFSAALVHELSTPLSVIQILLSQLTEQTPNGDEKSQRRLEMVQVNVGRMHQIIHDTLELSRSANSQVAEVCLTDALQEAANAVAVLASPQNVQIHFERPAKPNYVQGRYTQLVQLFTNLMKNAKDAVEASGKGEGIVAAKILEKRGDILVHIEDNGIGLSDLDKNQMFHPFFTTKSKVKGTGLGLTICQMIVKAHSGQIRFESDAGPITRVVVRLPKVPRNSLGS